MKPKKTLVPIKPTKKMIKAAQRMLIDIPRTDHLTPTDYLSAGLSLDKGEIEHLWALMLEARK